MALNGTTADELFSEDAGISLPSDMKHAKSQSQKDSSLGKYLVIGGAVLSIIGSGIAYKIFGDNAKNATPDKYPVSPIIETTNISPVPSIPEQIPAKTAYPVDEGFRSGQEAADAFARAINTKDPELLKRVDRDVYDVFTLDGKVLGEIHEYKVLRETSQGIAKVRFVYKNRNGKIIRDNILIRFNPE